MINVENTTYKPQHYKFQYKVPMTSIDAYLPAHSKIDFVKMDIQGAEYPALLGMKKTLTYNNHIVILTEVWPYGLKECGNSIEQVFEFLFTLGFSIYLIKNNSLEEIKELSQFNYITDEEYYYNIIASRNELPKIVFNG
jgi:hypothetical protein